MSPSLFQWFFSQRFFISILALVFGALHAFMFLVFVANAADPNCVGDLRMEVLTPWIFLTFLSCILCFGVAYIATYLSQFNTDRPWYDKAQVAERNEINLRDENAKLRSDLRQLREAAETQEAAGKVREEAMRDLRSAAESFRVTAEAHAQQLAFVEPRLKVAEEWLKTHAKKRVMTTRPSNHAEVQDMPNDS